MKNKIYTSKDWVVWCNSKKEGEEDHRFEHHGKKLFSSYDEKKSKVGDEQEKKGGKKPVRVSVTDQSLESRWKQGNIKMAASKNYANCWVHKDFLYTANNVEMLREAFEASGRKDECQVRVTGIEREYWMGIEIGKLGDYGFQGAVTAGDGSNQKGERMGAGIINLRRKK